MTPEEARREMQKSENANRVIQFEAPEIITDDEWEQILKEGTPYIEIFIDDTIAPPMSKYMRHTFEAAVELGVEHIVISINSGGGYLFEADLMAEVLEEYDDQLTFHTFVDDHAISACIWTVFSSDHIFLKPNATIGGATAYRYNPFDEEGAETDEDLIDELVEFMTKVAKRKGHNAQFAKGMMKFDYELWYADSDNDGDYEYYEEKPSGINASPLVRDDQILTLSREQIMEHGMGDGVINSSEEIGSIMGYPGWTKIAADDDVLENYNRIFEINEYLKFVLEGWYVPFNMPLPQNSTERAVWQRSMDIRRSIKARLDALRDHFDDFGDHIDTAMANDPRMALRIWDAGQERYIVEDVLSWQEQTAIAAAAIDDLDRVTKTSVNSLNEIIPLQADDDARNRAREAKGYFRRVVRELKRLEKDIIEIAQDGYEPPRDKRDRDDD